MYVCLDLEHIAVCSVAFVLDLQSGWTFHYHHHHHRRRRRRRRRRHHRRRRRRHRLFFFPDPK